MIVIRKNTEPAVVINLGVADILKTLELDH